jgi:biopolymer transport protein ExbD
MNRPAMIPVLRTAGLSGCIDGVAIRLIQRAARSVPGALSERLEEEWLAIMWEQRGWLGRFNFALGCWWAAAVITRDQVTVCVPRTCAATGGAIMVANAHRPISLLSRVMPLAARDDAMCEINTTPLIDVMLVLLVTLIITLPIMTHAVKLDLPQTPPSRDQKQPEVIDLDIDFDGTVVWNGTSVANMQQLDNYLRAEARRDPQPEIHLRADRRVKYDVVAKVLASAQHDRIKKVGFADTAQFKD